MRYRFLVDTYETERLKVLGVWSMFHEEDLPVRPHPTDLRGRSFLEQMQHQCLSENAWFCNMLGIDIGAPPLPPEETRLGFVLQYGEDSAKRLGVLRSTENVWWEEEVAFFDVPRSRAWIMVRRIAHTSHHRGQQMAMLQCSAGMCTATTVRRPIREGRLFTSRYRCSSGSSRSALSRSIARRSLAAKCCAARPPISSAEVRNG